jgi:hypothetical protein
LIEKEQSRMNYGASLESLFQAYFDCRKNKRNTALFDSP